MSTDEQIQLFFNSLPEHKSKDLLTLHQWIRNISPQCKLWFDTGINADNKIICNPTLGYGMQVLPYANGKIREFFQIGISPNATGISIYLLGFKDKKYIAETYGNALGKAKISGYCIRIKSLNDIRMDILKTILREGMHAKQGG